LEKDEEKVEPRLKLICVGGNEHDNHESLCYHRENVNESIKIETFYAYT